MTACNDGSFGPISDCRFFDFTATFSNVVLGILPAALALVCLAARLYVVGRKRNLDLDPGRRRHGSSSSSSFAALQRRLGVAGGDAVGTLAASVAVAHAALNFVLLALLLRPQSGDLRLALQGPSIEACTALSLITAIVAVPLVVLERRRTRGGAMFLPLWLLSTLLFDASRIRSFAGMAQVKGTPWFYVFVVSFTFKAVMLGFEDGEGVELDHVSTRQGRAGFLSRLVFAWLVPLLWSGYKVPITMESLDPLRPEFGSDRLYRAFIKKWSGCDASTRQTASTSPLGGATTGDDDQDEDQGSEENGGHGGFPTADLKRGSDVSLRKLASSSSAGTAQRSQQRHQQQPRGPAPMASFPKKANRSGLIVSAMLAYPSAFFAPVPWMLIDTASTLALPFLVSATLSFVQSFDESLDRPAKPTAFGWGLVGAYALVYLIHALSTGQYWWSVSKLMVKLRGAMIEAIYRKGLVLHLDAARKSGGGKAANLMSVDTERIINCVDIVHQVWSGVVSILIGCYVLHSVMGIAFIAPILTVGVCLAAMPIISRGMGARQKAWSESTDARVNLMNSVVADIKGVKFAAYDDVIESKLLAARDVEISAMRRFYRKFIQVGGFSNAIGRLMLVTSFITLFLVDRYTGSSRFTLNNVFTAITLIGIVEEPMLRFGQDYAKLLAAKASVERIQDFLGQEECGPLREEAVAAAAVGKGPSAVADDRAVGAAKEQPFAAVLEGVDIAWKDHIVLRDVTIKFPSGRLSIICGRLGEGKSTLIQTLMGETDIVAGTCRLPLLASQVAYVSQDVWLQETNSIRQNIIFASDMWDSERFAVVLQVCALDQDVAQLSAGVETKASALSGGQRQRVAVARALYSDAASYVFDDITSALDAETAAHMWRALFGSHGMLKGKTVVMATNAIHLLSDAALVVRIEGGRIAETGSYEQLSFNGKRAISRNSLESSRRSSEEIPEAAEGNAASSPPNRNGSGGGDDSGTEEVEVGSVGTAVVKMWVQAAWALEQEIHPFHNSAIYAASWTALVVAMVLSLFGCLYVLTIPANTRAGVRLHVKELRGVLRAPMSFFDGTSAGRIANRFSQDLSILTFAFPIALLNGPIQFFHLLGLMATFVVPAPFLVVVCLFVMTLATSTQRLYAPASRQLRRLEMAAKSPLYQLFGELSTVSGLATLRGLRREALFSEANSRILDASQKPYYSLYAVRRWLQTWLLLFTMVVNTLLVAIVVILRHSSNAGAVGVALVQATMLGIALNQAVIGYTEAEIAAVALERIRQFCNIVPEEATGTAAVVPVSPGSRSPVVDARSIVGSAQGGFGGRGSIVFDDVTVSYRADLDPAIKGLYFRLPAGQRLGIVGRSGSGKSTTLPTLFRLLETSSGRIEIDGVATSELPVKELRSRMSIVPQSPLILAATVRDNGDPEGACDDDEIWNALRQCHVAELVKNFSGQLEEMLGGERAFLSAGQRQLLALARAVLRRRSILVLDETTSAMDIETDTAVQDVLRTAFGGCTIIAVAHRIANIINSDHNICMQTGIAIEVGSPDELLARPDGTFRALAVEQKCI